MCVIQPKPKPFSHAVKKLSEVAALQDDDSMGKMGSFEQSVLQFPNNTVIRFGERNELLRDPKVPKSLEAEDEISKPISHSLSLSLCACVCVMVVDVLGSFLLLFLD